MRWRLYWINGETEEVEGPNLDAAMQNAGYSPIMIDCVEEAEELGANAPVMVVS